MKSLTLVPMLLILTGCGVAETGAVATTGGASAAAEARRAKQTEDQVRQRLDTALQQGADRNAQAEAATQ